MDLNDLDSNYIIDNNDIQNKSGLSALPDI